MSQERPMPSPALVGPKTPIRFDQFRRAPGLSVIGLPELIGLACAVLLALITIFAYLYFYVPAHSRLASTEMDRNRLQAQLHTSDKQLKEDTSARETVDKINASLEDFESNWLAASGSGRMSLYSVLNNLIRSNGLRNTAGPSYSPLEPVGTKSQVQPTASAEKQSNAKWQTIYPGIAVSVTVEGPYQNVRHFVRDIEASRQFLIVNAVELESVTQTGALQDLPAVKTPPVPPRGGGKVTAPTSAPLAGGRATLVSLRLDLATYFRRPEVKNAATP